MINFGILGQGRDVGQAAVQGFEMGRQRRKELEADNALRAYAANPDDAGAINALLQYNPQLGMQLREDQAKRQETQALQQVTGAAVQGDQGAMQQLAGLNPELWMRLDKNTQETTKQRVEIIGQAALYADTPEKWDQVIDQLSQQYPDLAQYKGKFSPQARAAAIAQAGEMKAFIDQQKIDYQVIPEGGYLQGFDNMGRPLGDVRSQPPQQVAPAPSGAPQGGFGVVGVPGDRETSGRRSAADNRRVRGVPNSYHLSGQASDRVPPPGMSMEAFAAELQRRNPTLEVINEGDHVHLEPRSRSASASVPPLPPGFVLD